MTPTIFNSLSHADFLKLTLEAFSRQGFEVERSSNAGADAVLVGKSGSRVALLCKKYRDAFIGRPVLQQLHAAMGQMRCKEGFLITTTDCAPDAHEFAKGKGLELYNRDRTTRLFLTAFGDAFMRTGKIPELGNKAKAVPAPARKPVTVASYEKVRVAEKKNERGPEKPIQSMPAPEPVRPPVLIHAPETVQASEPEQPAGAFVSPEPEPTPAPVAAAEQPKVTGLEMPSEPAAVAEQEQAAGPIQASEPAMAPPENAVDEELPEEVETVEDLEPPAPADAEPSKNMRTIYCAECNQPARVPTDQGMIKVQCSECGSRWLYQPELTEDGQVKTTTVIACHACSQKLNVPVDRGQLNVKCPKCGEKWLFTP